MQPWICHQQANETRTKCKLKGNFLKSSEAALSSVYLFHAEPACFVCHLKLTGHGNGKQAWVVGVETDTQTKGQHAGHWVVFLLKGRI